MSTKYVAVFLVFAFLNVVLASFKHELKSTPNNTFPKSFIFGVSTSAYQIEGAWNEDGKSENIWDYATHRNSNLIGDGQNADISCDSYHLWKKDVFSLKLLHIHYYRFSISWSRLLPTGDSNNVNPHAVRYYNNLINELIEYEIEPIVTLYHWDLPQILQELGGWANLEIASYFENYAHTAFKLFGDRVKKWFTFNDPFEICQGGYGEGRRPPLIKSSGIGDYLCGRTVLLAHGNAYSNYYEHFAYKFKGKVGIAVGSTWYEPKTMLTNDFIATENMRQMHYGWFLNPIIHGEYPEIMVDQVKINSRGENYTRSRLPKFTAKEMSKINCSYDFVGINHLVTKPVSHFNTTARDPVSFAKDAGALVEPDPEQWSTNGSWLDTYAWGFRHQLQWFQEAYDNPIIYITGIGYPDDYESYDLERSAYIYYYLSELLTAIHFDKINVQGVFVWSLMDNIDWDNGYKAKYGLYYVNFSDPNRQRIIKKSGKFYSYVLSTRRINGYLCENCTRVG